MKFEYSWASSHWMAGAAIGRLMDWAVRDGPYDRFTTHSPPSSVGIFALHLGIANTELDRETWVRISVEGMLQA